MYIFKNNIVVGLIFIVNWWTKIVLFGFLGKLMSCVSNFCQKLHLIKFKLIAIPKANTSIISPFGPVAAVLIIGVQMAYRTRLYSR